MTAASKREENTPSQRLTHSSLAHRMSAMPPLIEGNKNNNGQSADYYAAGSAELATETKLTLSRLEPVSGET